MTRIIKHLRANAFYYNTVLLFLYFSFATINDVNPENNNKFWETIRITQLVLIIIIAIIFYFKLVKKSNDPKAFYSTDKFYCDLLYLTLLIGVSLTIHFINWETTDIYSAVKIWEIAAYSVTLTYTLWLWIAKLGLNFIKIIEHKLSAKKEDVIIEKIKLFGAIGISVLFLIGIILSHLAVTLYNSYSYSMQSSIFLICITYFLFENISARVVYITKDEIENRKNENDITHLNKHIKEYQHEFKFGLKYMDRPMKWVFIIMLIYAAYATGLDYFAEKHVMNKLELFFGGAIAFELLLSSLVWAKNN